LNFLDISPEHRNIYFGVHDEWTSIR
jgi:hypothetical protein